MGNIESITVKEGDRERTILIPGLSRMDKHEAEDIIEWQTEKTKKELRQPKPERKYSRKEVGQVLREYNEFRKRKAEGTKRYF
jgi:hypothetical protein